MNAALGQVQSTFTETSSIETGLSIPFVKLQTSSPPDALCRFTRARNCRTASVVKDGSSSGFLLRVVVPMDAAGSGPLKRVFESTQCLLEPL